MPKVSQEHRDARRAQILRAAAACFERKGYQRTTMADIIRESGLSAGAIYVYFTGKQDIVRAVAEESLSNRAETIIAQADDGALGPAALVAAAVDSPCPPSRPSCGAWRVGMPRCANSSSAFSATRVPWRKRLCALGRSDILRSLLRTGSAPRNGRAVSGQPSWGFW